MKSLRVLSQCLLLFCLFSCEKLFIKPDPENTEESNFESMWKRIDEKYSFFEFKNLDWDSVYAVYRPMVFNGMGEDSLFRVLDATLYTLRDGHVNLITPYNISRNWQWYLDYPQNYNAGLMERNYLGNDYEITAGIVNTILVRNNKRIGYIHYSSFSSPVQDYALDHILNKFKNTDGIILDIRDNGGGLTTNIYKLLNRFVNEKVLVGRSYEKAGKAHNDFKLAYEMYAEPARNEDDELRELYLNKPVILLTNRSCYSAATMFAGFMSTLPNVTILGNPTGGGGGLPVSYQLPNGWYYRFSATATLLPDGFNVEHGAPVDILQNMDPANEALGVDDIMEKAFTLF